MKKIGYIVLAMLILSSCQLFEKNSGNSNSSNQQESTKEELKGWDYLSKIKLNVPGGRDEVGFWAGHTCEGSLYVKSIEQTIYYKVLVKDDKDPYRPKYSTVEEKEYLVERNPLYQSKEAIHLAFSSYKYKAGRYYFNIDY